MADTSPPDPSANRLLQALRAAEAKTAPLRAIASPIPALPSLSAPPSIANPKRDLASDYVERIEEQIQDFQKTVEADETVVVQLFLPNLPPFFPFFFGYHNPDMVVVDAYDSGPSDREIRLLVPKGAVVVSLSKYTAAELADEPPRRPIGFQAAPVEDTPET
jgi:hypothetical protein